MIENESLESLETRSFSFESLAFFEKRSILIRCVQRISFIKLNKRSWLILYETKVHELFNYVLLL